MKYSLISRDWITDCIEITHAGYTGVRIKGSCKSTDETDKQNSQFHNALVVIHEYMLYAFLEIINYTNSQGMHRTKNGLVALSAISS